jgi:carbon storage regulator
MLVLSRKVGERTLVDQNTWVEVLEVRGDRVRLGFTAPPDVDIFREELIPTVPADRPSDELDLVEA